jgi:hypothetical protein
MSAKQCQSGDPRLGGALSAFDLSGLNRQLPPRGLQLLWRRASTTSRATPPSSEEAETNRRLGRFGRTGGGFPRCHGRRLRSREHSPRLCEVLRRGTTPALARSLASFEPRALSGSAGRHRLVCGRFRLTLQAQLAGGRDLHGQRRASSNRGSSRTAAKSSSRRASSRNRGNSSTDRRRWANVSSSVSPASVAKHA